MPVIGELATLVDARTQPFERKMGRSGAVTKRFTSEVRQADRPLRQFDSRLARTSRTAGGFNKSVGLASNGLATLGRTAGTAAIGLVAGAASLQQFTDSADRLDRLGKTAQTLGETTANLTGMQHAASLSGVEVEQLTTSLRTMIRNVGDAANGTGEAQDALNELGVDAQRLRSLRPSQAVEELADAFGRVANQNDRVRLAVDIFGRSGAEMLRVLDLGSTGLRDMQREAREMGFALSDEAVDAVEEMNDSIDRLSSSLQGATDRAVAFSASPISSFVNALNEDIKTLNRSIAGLGIGDGDGTLERFFAIGQQGASLSGLSDNLNLLLGNQAFRDDRAAANRVAGQRRDLEAAGDAVEAAEQNVDRTERRGGDVGRAERELEAARREQSQQLKQVRETLERQTRNDESLGAETGRQLERLIQAMENAEQLEVREVSF